jgi:hypothetical protein
LLSAGLLAGFSGRQLFGHEKFSLKTEVFFMNEASLRGFCVASRSHFKQN